MCCVDPGRIACSLDQLGVPFWGTSSCAALGASCGSSCSGLVVDRDTSLHLACEMEALNVDSVILLSEDWQPIDWQVVGIAVKPVQGTF